VPRTAPDVTTAATFRTVSVRFVDFNGDLRTISARVPSAATVADVEAMVAAYTSLTNANLYEVQITDRWAAVPAAQTADEEVHMSVYDNVALNFKDIVAGLQQTIFLPAPIDTLIDAGDVVDTTIVDYVTWRDAWDTLLAGNYEPLTARFTERRNKNDTVPA